MSGAAGNELPGLDAEPERSFEIGSPLTATGNLRRRAAVSAAARTAATGAALLAIGVLAAVIFTVVSRGAAAISWDFVTTNPPRFGGPGGGIASALVGTALLVACATVIALPIGVLVALYLTEFANRRVAGIVRMALDLLNGLPSIIIGVFVFGLLVSGHRQSGFAGSFALSIIMLPLVARTAQEALLRVPGAQREAAQALGVSHWRTITGVILPASFGGILTGTVLAVARIAGETAPLIFTTSVFAGTLALNPFGETLPNIPVMIFTLSEQADPDGFTRAWGAALVLLAFILIANVGARRLHARNERKLHR